MVISAPSEAVWAVSGNGVIDPPAPADGSKSVTFTAPSEAEKVTISATLKEDGSSDSITVDVVEPSGVMMVNKLDFQNQGTVGFIDHGFAAQFFIEPSDVNFQAIAVYEDTTPGIAEGHYADIGDNAEHEKWDKAVALTGHEEGKGTTNTIIWDQIRTGIINSSRQAGKHYYSDGSFTWNISWKYKLGNVDKKFTEVEQKEVIRANDETKRVTLLVTKGGASAGNPNTINNLKN